MKSTNIEWFFWLSLTPSFGRSEFCMEFFCFPFLIVWCCFWSGTFIFTWPSPFERERSERERIHDSQNTYPIKFRLSAGCRCHSFNCMEMAGRMDSWETKPYLLFTSIVTNLTKYSIYINDFQPNWPIRPYFSASTFFSFSDNTKRGEQSFFFWRGSASMRWREWHQKQISSSIEMEWNRMECIQLTLPYIVFTAPYIHTFESNHTQWALKVVGALQTFMT